jgi:hypothetical protein
MSPAFLTAAFLSHILPTKDSLDERQVGSEPDRDDPEKGGPSGSSVGQDQAFRVEPNGDGDDTDEESEDLDHFEENRGIEFEPTQGAANSRRSSRGVPLTPTVTMSSSSTNTFSRPSAPRWLVKIREGLLGPLRDREEPLPTYRRAAIISGNLIPFSILLEIPGLTQSWYVQTDGYQIVYSRKNPPWVIASLSVSLALAVLANIALVYRFLERRVKRSTIIAITALTTHGDSLLSRHTSTQVELSLLQTY